jgi:hypothetical protein
VDRRARADSCGAGRRSPAFGRRLGASRRYFPRVSIQFNFPPLLARNLPESGSSRRRLGSAASWKNLGSTASITTAPDGAIWAVVAATPGGGGASAGVHPIFQLDTSGKVLKNLAPGFVSPHKLTLDNGFLWLADNGSHQS